MACADTGAGYTITNVAEVRFLVDQTQSVVLSNRDELPVVERLDVSLTRVGDAPVTVTGGTTPVPLILVNQGNGPEAFRLSATSGVPGISVRSFAVDTDGDGIYNPATDHALTAGQTDILAPGSALTIFALVDTPETLADPDGALTVTASAVTGTGAPGTVFAGAGVGGGDAVVGPTGALAQVQVGLTVIVAGAQLTKTQSVVAPDGSAAQVRGAIITYTLTANFAAPATGVRIEDRLPDSVRYIPGTLTIDDVPVADSGNASPSAISVALGDVNSPGIRTLQFKVKIQ